MSSFKEDCGGQFPRTGHGQIEVHLGRCLMTPCWAVCRPSSQGKCQRHRWRKKVPNKWKRNDWALLLWLLCSLAPASYLTVSNPSHCLKSHPHFSPFRFWHPGEPNSHWERCVTLNNPTKRSWGWNDVTCNLRHSSICKMMKIHLWVGNSPWTCGWISSHQ